MSLRTQIRKLRLYYKSLGYLQSVLADPAPIYWLPLCRHEMQLQTRAGMLITVPAGAWYLLPTMCKLAAIGATTRIEANAKRITIRGLSYLTPLQPKGEGTFFREIFADDVYRLNGQDFAGKRVVDIGAHIGDFSVLLASQGATVYAFEPSQLYGDYCRRNAALNGVAERVHLFNVGLGQGDGEQRTTDDVLRFAAASSYVTQHLPRAIDFLKMDCEGCEYALFADPCFLDHLAPQVIAMEYHRGPEALRDLLVARNYQVETVAGEGDVGYLYAHKSAG